MSSRAYTGLAGAILLTATASVAAGGLGRATVAGWENYVSATEARIARELAGRDRRFLALDFGADAAGDRRAVLSGAIVVRPASAVDAHGRTLAVPGALVHHWRGAVLVRGATLSQVMKRLEGGAPPTRQEDVLQSVVLDRGPDRLRVFLKLRRTKFVTVVYNTEHVVTFRRQGPTRAVSASTATKIAELTGVGTPHERELAPGDDRGFLWRLNSYWRYEQGPDGVIAECESVSLSRSVPSVLEYLVGPLIERTARESMERTLAALRVTFDRAESGGQGEALR
jgi:hypothetical protein